MRGWIGVQVNPMAEVLADSFGMTDPRKAAPLVLLTLDIVASSHDIAD
jgi:hypothetical protein